MTNGYFKVCALEKIQGISVDGVEGEEAKTIAARGYLRSQETFFYDGNDPSSIRAAWESALTYSGKVAGRISTFKNPNIGGPWDGLPFVGQGIGEAN